MRIRTTGATPLVTRSPDADRDDLKRRLVVLTFTRLLVAAVLFIATIAIGGAGSAGERPIERGLRYVVLGIFAVSIPYALLLARGRALRALAVVQIGVDLAAWTALVYATGGPASPMSFFFVLSTLTAALVLGESAARVTAVVAIAIYGSLALAMTNGMLPTLSDGRHDAPLGAGELSFQLVINVVGLLAVASLGGNLASRLSRAGGALARLEASREALTALHEDVLRSIPDALLTCDARGVIDSANPAAAALLGVPVEQLPGTAAKRWLPFLPDDVFSLDHAATSGDESLVRGTDTLRIAWRAAPLYDREGAVRGGLLVIEDRSDLEALRERAQRSERLAELGRLTAGLAHEVRNPLGAISGCVELVREGGAVSQEDRELLSTVLREVERLNNLVTDMLTFARPRPPQRTAVSIVTLAREVVKLANGDASSTRVVLGGIDDETVMVHADAGQLRQVLWNLVRNAVSASPADAPVEVNVGASMRGVELVVADRGRGIAPEQREKLFELFYSERERGTGLGLAIVKQIVDAHGAVAEVRSREGGGTEFVVRFPNVNVATNTNESV